MDVSEICWINDSLWLYLIGVWYLNEVKVWRKGWFKKVKVIFIGEFNSWVKKD